ncbi:hypothetical protein ACIBG8_21020 [Nonomuraea sp. NPDC050556]|uniref:hypothetical protein n=1 Tax=Nonomuraea sp. NPDC050556 TaxID=3364369 RepID=UPI0037AE0B52
MNRKAVAATIWSLAYGSLGLAWALGAPRFPWGATDPDPDRALSILATATPEVAGWWIAGLGAAAAVAVLTSARWFLYPLAATLILVIPDSRLMMGLAYSPLLAVKPLTGWPDADVSLADAWPWEVVNQLLCVLGGVLLIAAAWRPRRTGWTSPESAARWGRWAVYVAVTVPLIYCSTRWAWALGIPLGVDREFLVEGAKDAPGIWLAGAYLATFGALGGLLTLGLIQRWGEVFPRWIPFLRGRRVPPKLAVVPATLVAIIIAEAGFTYLRKALSGEWLMEEWGAWLPETFWPVWGGALAAAALAYHLRRRVQP